MTEQCDNTDQALTRAFVYAGEVVDKELLALVNALKLLGTGHVVQLPSWRVTARAAVPTLQIVSASAQARPQSLIWSSTNASAVNKALLGGITQVTPAISQQILNLSKSSPESLSYLYLGV